MSNGVEAANGSWTIFTLKPGFAFSKRATPFVRNDWAAGTPYEPDASASFQIVIVGSLPPPPPLPLDELEQAAARIEIATATMSPVRDRLISWPTPRPVPVVFIATLDVSCRNDSIRTPPADGLRRLSRTDSRIDVKRSARVT